MTLRTDTLVSDSARIALWQSDPKFNYNRELLVPEVSFFELINSWMRRVLDKIFDSQYAYRYSEIVPVGILIVILLLLFWILYKKRPELFMKSHKHAVAHQIKEDTIYGVDFAKEIAAAVERSDFREAIRFLYLQTLELLSVREIIDWQPHKTPTEYLYEAKRKGANGSFRSLTIGFLRIRYGNFEATGALFKEMQALQTQIMEGGRA